MKYYATILLTCLALTTTTWAIDFNNSELVDETGNLRGTDASRMRRLWQQGRGMRGWRRGGGMTGTASNGSSNSVPSVTTSTALSANERQEILFMREEEKLARDVYLTLFQKWGVRVFSNIADSEQNHMDSMLALINQFDLDDPVKDNSIGVFTDPSLQQTYTTLVTEGLISEDSGLMIGAYIEELDIRDLRQAMAETDQSTLDSTYERLLTASYNHLRAFVRNIENRSGKTYQAQLLTQEEVDAIVG